MTKWYSNKYKHIVVRNVDEEFLMQLWWMIFSLKLFLIFVSIYFFSAVKFWSTNKLKKNYIKTEEFCRYNILVGGCTWHLTRFFFYGKLWLVGVSFTTIAGISVFALQMIDATLVWISLVSNFQQKLFIYLCFDKIFNKHFFYLIIIDSFAFQFGILNTCRNKPNIKKNWNIIF